jgi:predicted ester cyclase
MTQQEKNKALSRRALAEIDRGEFKTVEEMAVPGFRLQVPGAPDMDLEGFKGFCRMFAAAFPGFTHEIETLVAEGDQVVRIGTFRGTHKGDFMGVPPTGRTVSMAFMSLDTYREGRIASIRVCPDMLGLMQQLGAIPAPA